MALGEPPWPQVSLRGPRWAFVAPGEPPWPQVSRRLIPGDPLMAPGEPQMALR
jgi:hypothetical protein